MYTFSIHSFIHCVSIWCSCKVSVTELGIGRIEFIEKLMQLELQGPPLTGAPSREGPAEEDNNVFS